MSQDAILELPVGITAGQEHEKVFELKANDYLHVEVEQLGIDIELELVDEQGKTRLLIDSPNGRWGKEVLRFIASEPGTYRLRIRARGHEGQGEYGYWCEPVRPAGEPALALTRADEILRQGREQARDARNYDALFTASRLYEEAIEIYHRHEEASRTAETLFALSRVLLYLHRTEEALERCRDAKEIYRRLADTKTLALVLDRLGFLHLQMGEPAAAKPVLEEAVQLFAARGEPAGAALAFSRLATAELKLGHPDRALTFLAKGLDFSRQGGNRRWEAALLCDLAALQLDVRHPDAALDNYRQAVAIYREVAGSGLELALGGLADALRACGEMGEADRAIREALESFPEPCRERAVILITRGRLRREQENFAAARDDLDASIKLARDVRDRGTEAVALLERGHIEVAAGRPAEGQPHLDVAIDLFQKTGNRLGQASALMRLAEAYRDRALQASSAETRQAHLFLAGSRADRAWQLFRNPRPPAREDPLAGPSRAPGDLFAPTLTEEHYEIAHHICELLEVEEPEGRHAKRAERLKAEWAVYRTGRDSAVIRAYWDIGEPEQVDDPSGVASTDLPWPDDDVPPAHGIRKDRATDIDFNKRMEAARERDRERRRREQGLPAKSPDPAPEATDPAGSGSRAEGLAMSSADAESSAGPAVPSPEEVGKLLIRALSEGVLSRDGELQHARLTEEQRAEEERRRKTRRGLPAGIDPNDLTVTGWGVIFSRDVDLSIRHQLRLLLRQRKDDAGGEFPEQYGRTLRKGEGGRYRELTYKPGEGGERFLHRHGGRQGTFDPDRFSVPYYLLLVGDPEELPFELQYILGISHAVGRIHFDQPEQYGSWAQKVLDAERDGVDRSPRATFFGIADPGDFATTTLAHQMARPLALAVNGVGSGLRGDSWTSELYEPIDTERDDLLRALGGRDRPGFVFVSTHGLKKRPCSPDHAAQREAQGALKLPDGTYLRASDLPDGDYTGLVAFLFACYSAGTPMQDNFPQESPGNGSLEVPIIAERPFIARLPQELLARGALAVIGHVDRGWTLSCVWNQDGRAVQHNGSMKDALTRMLLGETLGNAMSTLTARSSQLAALLSHTTERIKNGEDVNPELLATQWTAHNDARNLILLGDPATCVLGKRQKGINLDILMERSGATSHVRLAEPALRVARARAEAEGMELGAWLERLIAS